MRNAECGLRIDEARRPRASGSLWLSVSLRSADEARQPRPAGSLWLFAFGHLHCIPVVSLRVADEGGDGEAGRGV